MSLYLWSCYQVAVIIPDTFSTAKFLLDKVSLFTTKGRQDRDRLIEYFADRCYDPNSCLNSFYSIRELFTRSWEYRPRYTFASDPPSNPTGTALLKALYAALDLKKFSSFETAVARGGKDVPVAIFSKVRERMDAGMLLPGDGKIGKRQ